MFEPALSYVTLKVLMLILEEGENVTLITDDDNDTQQVLRGSNAPVIKLRAARPSSHFQICRTRGLSYRVNGNFGVNDYIEDYFNNVM